MLTEDVLSVAAELESLAGYIIREPLYPVSAVRLTALAVRLRRAVEITSGVLPLSPVTIGAPAGHLRRRKDDR